MKISIAKDRCQGKGGGPRSGVDFCADIDAAYEIIVTWRKNVFKLPTGTEAKHFIQSLTKLLIGFGDATTLESVTFKAVAVMAPLLLQQPVAKASYGENRKHLSRRLALWRLVILLNY